MFLSKVSCYNTEINAKEKKLRKKSQFVNFFKKKMTNL